MRERKWGTEIILVDQIGMGTKQTFLISSGGVAAALSECLDAAAFAVSVFF